MNKKVWGVLKRTLVLALVVVLICLIPFVKVNSDDEMSMIFNAFVGNRSSYQGMIVVWNIDTFESGTATKSNYLNSVARRFEKNNKGTYVLVRNLTENECLNLLEKGEVPDVFSCSYGVAGKIEKYIESFSNENQFEIDEKLKTAGMVSGELKAVAWCRGIYTLLSTTEKLEKAGKNLENGEKLSSVLLSSGYEIKKKNSTKIVSSLSFGAAGRLLPQNAISAYTDNGLETSSATVLDSKSFEQSQYSAYANFLAGNSTILLGSQRDIARLEGRLESGKITDIVYEALYGKCDLVQFCMLAKKDDEIRKFYAEKFVSELVSLENQSGIKSIGMIPVISGLNPYEKGIMKDIISVNNGDYEVYPLFSK